MKPCMKKTLGAAGQGKMREVKKKEQQKMREEEEEEKGEKRKREEEKDGKETGTGKRRCKGFVSVEAFDFLSRERSGELW